jgi:hypothetical protein
MDVRRGVQIECCPGAAPPQYQTSLSCPVLCCRENACLVARWVLGREKIEMLTVDSKVAKRAHTTTTAVERIESA